MDSTRYEWSPAERFVSGTAPGATSPAVEISLFHVSCSSVRVIRQEAVFKENHAYRT